MRRTGADFRLAIKLVAACGGTKSWRVCAFSQGEVTSQLTGTPVFLSDEARWAESPLLGACGRYFFTTSRINATRSNLFR